MVRCLRGAQSESALRSDLALLKHRVYACHAACSRILAYYIMHARLHAQRLTGSAPVPPSRPMPGQARGGNRTRARATCTRHMHARGMACCMHKASGMKNAACMPNSRHGDYRRSPPSLSENRRFRRFSEKPGTVPLQWLPRLCSMHS